MGNDYKERGLEWVQSFTKTRNKKPNSILLEKILFFPIFDLGFFFTHIERYYKILLHLI